MSFQVPKGNSFATSNVNESLGREIPTLPGIINYNILNMILKYGQTWLNPMNDPVNIIL